MINYLLGSPYPHFYCFLLPTAFPSPLPSVQSSIGLEHSGEENAEIIPEKSESPFEE